MPLRVAWICSAVEAAEAETTKSIAWKEYYPNAESLLYDEQNSG